MAGGAAGPGAAPVPVWAVAGDCAATGSVDDGSSVPKGFGDGAHDAADQARAGSGEG